MPSAKIHALARIGGQRVAKRIQYTDRDRRARIPEWIPSTDGIRSIEVLDGYHLGEIRDRSLEQQYCASGLTLATAAIALWNTVYLERATNALREHGHTPDPALRKHLSLFGWEHVNLTGDYEWRNTAKLGKSKFRPLRKP